MSRLAASYRDPSGFIFSEDGVLKRQINPIFFEEYDAVVNADIYNRLSKKGWLIPHQEIHRDTEKILLLPDQIPLVTYPYEWSFTQYKHAAQLTLRLQMFLLENGFSLKDASAFNITFHQGKAIFIDTLSIERYKPDEPWRALQQFEMHFFSILLLAQKYGAQHLKTLASDINGKDLKETSRLLSWKSRFHPVIYPNIHLMASSDSGKPLEDETGQKVPKISKESQLKILKVLELHISKMSLSQTTEWTEYYDQINYNPEAFEFKKQKVHAWGQEIETVKAIDLGGNDGTFAKELPDGISQIIVCDIDQAAIDHCYKTELKNSKSRLIPMVCDLMQPSPGIGFANQERESFIERIQKFQPELSLALALIHHITLTGNVPFEMSAAFFASLSPYLIIEFPDRQDSWVQYILDSKRDARHLFDDYEVSAFAKAYSQFYNIDKREVIPGTHRTLFLMRRK